MHVGTPREATLAQQQVKQLIDALQPLEAVTFAEACEGNERFVTGVRAVACTQAGEIEQDAALLERAIELWGELDGESDPAMGYNLANAEYALWRVARAKLGFVAALEQKRQHLHRARALFNRAGEDPNVPMELKAQALTNLANSYDDLGRDVDALAAYDRALGLDPGFAMAVGNRGTTLLGIAAFMGDHHPRVLVDAAQALDTALADPEQIIRFGGQSALDSFQAKRAQIKGDTSPMEGGTPADWTDPHLRWCAKHALFLHVSMVCLSADAREVDPLFFRGVTVGLSDEEQTRANAIVDAFNALKQDYIAARYLLWLATDDQSPITEHADAVTTRARFLDTNTYGEWGIQSGLASQVFAAVINLLDKVASFVHLYLATGRASTQVYFRGFWGTRQQRGSPLLMDPELAAQFAGIGNRGLLALCDLSCDLERDTPLNMMVRRRHSATHRFLSVHWMLVDPRNDPSGWLERVTWRDLVDGALEQMAMARAALIYLARLIDLAEHEARQLREVSKQPGVVPSMPLFRAEPTPRD
jgi:hypothetical protein